MKIAVILAYIGGALSILVILLLVSLYSTYPISNTVLHDRMLVANNDTAEKLTAREARYLRSLVKKGYVDRPGEVLTALTSFYDTVIIILVTIIGIVGVFAYFSVRAISIRSAEDMAQAGTKKGVDTYFGSKRFSDELTAIIESELAEVKQGSTYFLEKAEAKLLDLEMVLERAESLIAANDKNEVVADEELVSDGADDKGNGG